jgi:hypothetical protein
VDARGGVSAIRCLAARESPSIALDVTISSDDGAPRWRYEMEFNQDNQRVPHIRQERVTNLRADRVLIDRPDEADEEDEIRLTQTLLEQVFANREFRDIADLFGSISYQHIIPQVVRDPQGFSPVQVKNDPFGRDFLQRLWNTPGRTRDAWLRRISAVLEQAVPQLVSLEVEMDDQGSPHLVGRYKHWRQHDAKQNESQFSDGTLRLLGLMWAMFEGDGPLLLEEPELSLHIDIVRQLAELMEGLKEEIRCMRRRSKPQYEPRQLLISTHSKELLSTQTIGAHEVLLIRPDMEGAELEPPDEQDRMQLKLRRMTPADVLLPKTRPANGQLHLFQALAS